MRELSLKLSQLALELTQSQAQIALVLIDLLEPLLILLILMSDLLYSVEFLLSPINHLLLDSPGLLVGVLALVQLGRHDRLVLLVVLVKTADVRFKFAIHLVLEAGHVELQIRVRGMVQLMQL